MSNPRRKSSVGVVDREVRKVDRTLDLPTKVGSSMIAGVSYLIQYTNE